EHEKHEQVEVGEETPITSVVRHVTGGVEMNEPANAGDDEQHDQRQLVHLERKIHTEVAGVDPGEVGAYPGELYRGETREFAGQLRRGEEGKRCCAQGNTV